MEPVGAGPVEPVGPVPVEPVGSVSAELMRAVPVEPVGAGPVEPVGPGPAEPAPVESTGPAPTELMRAVPAEPVGSVSAELMGAGPVERVGPRSAEPAGTVPVESMGAPSPEPTGSAPTELMRAVSAESMGTGPAEPTGSASADPTESAPAESRLPGDEAAASQQMLPPVAEARGVVQAEPTLAGGQAFPERQTTAPAEAFGERATAPYQQLRGQQAEAPRAGAGGVSRATGPDPARQGEKDRYSMWGQPREQDWQQPDPARNTGTSSYPGTSQHAGTAYSGNDPSDPHTPEYLAGPGDTATPQHGGDFPYSGTSSRPPQRDVSSQQPTQHPAVPGHSPPTWSQQGDDSLGFVPKEGKAPAYRKRGRDQQAPAGWPQQLQPSSQQTAAVGELLKMLPVVENDQEFWSILREILGPGVPPEADRRRARREMSKPEWYTQMERSGRVLDVNTLSQLFQKIIIPDLGDPLVVTMITQWAVDKQPVVVGGLLAAASESADDIWQSVMQILQPRLAYRWMADNGIETLWSPSMAPQSGSESGRGRFSFWKRN